MKFRVFDTEGVGLNSAATKLHNLCFTDDGKQFHYTTSYEEMREWLSEPNVLWVCHSAVGHDMPAIKSVLGYEMNYKDFWDTLGISWYLYPDRPKHGLEALGTEHGIKKVKVEEHQWAEGDPELMKERVIEDVKINWSEFQKQKDRLCEIYGSSEVNEEILRFIRYISFRMDCLREQNEHPLTIDLEKAQRHSDELAEVINEKTEALARVMPKVPGKMQNKPKNLYKKDGSYSKLGKDWFDLLKTLKLPNNTEGPVVTEWKNGNPGSTAQVKEWLYSLGWSPCTFKFERNKLNGEEKKIPQVRYVAQSDPRKGQLTDSVLRLKDREPAVEILEGLTVAQHRKSIFDGFLSASTADGKCVSSAGGLTNTLRLKHRAPIVNLPGVDSYYGKEIRGCIVAPDAEHVLCGADVVSLEDSTKRHYMKPLDPVYVEEMNKPGYDPHMALLVVANKITQDDYNYYIETKANGGDKSIERFKRLDDMRAGAKTVNYCLPLRTKVLTKGGWKFYSEIKVGETLPVYEHLSNTVVDGTVGAKHYYQKTDVVRVSNKHSSFDCTPNHRWYSCQRVNIKGGRGYYRMDYVETKDLKTDHNILLSAPYQPSEGVSDVTPYEAMFMGFLLSDGYYKWSNYSEGPSTSGGKRRGLSCMIAQSQGKYWSEVEKCLDKIGVDYRKDTRETDNGNNVFCYYLTQESARETLDRIIPGRSNPQDYNWTAWVMRLSRQALESFYYGFYLGDGDMKAKHVGISQNEGNVMDGVVAASQLLGWGRVGVSGNRSCKYIRLHSTDRMTCQNTKVEDIGQEDTFCLTTSHGSFIIWQDGFVGITGNSALYGVGAKKLAREAGMKEREATALLKAFWELNWSIQKVASQQYVKTLNDGSMWLKNEVSGFYYSLRYDKDRWSTTNQGTGVFIFDSWVMRARKKGIKVSMSYHDEILFSVPKGEEKATEEALHEAMQEVNESLKLNVTIGVDVKFGQSYAECH